MTLLKALREITRCGPPVVDTWFCAICKNIPQPLPGYEPHKDFCPWRQMPQIIAALEAAAAFVAANDGDDAPMDDLMRLEDDLHEAFGGQRRYGERSPRLRLVSDTDTP